MRAKLQVLIASALFGSLAAAVQLSGVAASPASAGFARILLGGGLLGIAAIWASASARTAPPAPASTHRRVPTWVVALIGALGVLGYQPLYFVGTGVNGVAVGTVVALGSAPVITGAAEVVFHRRAPGVRWMVATALCIVGVAMTSGLMGAPVSLGSGGGVLWSVAAGACYATYAVAAKELMERGWTSRRAMGALFGVAAVASLPLLIVVGAEWLFTPRGLALVVWLGVFGTALGYLLFGWGLAVLPATTVTTLTLAEPLCATLLGIGVLRESLSLVAAIGLGVLALGLTLITIQRSRGDVAATT